MNTMTKTQRARLEALSRAYLNALANWHHAQIHGDASEIHELAAAADLLGDTYRHALSMRGFVVGDTVQVVCGGRYAGRVFMVREVNAVDLLLGAEGLGVSALPGHIELYEKAA